LTGLSLPALTRSDVRKAVESGRKLLLFGSDPIALGAIVGAYSAVEATSTLLGLVSLELTNCRCRNLLPGAITFLEVEAGSE
jgi:hypothetical protein